MKNKRIGIWLIRGMQAGLICLTILGYIKNIFISLDIDESYAVAQSYRLAMGEHLFVDMWEPHQLSAFFSAVFIKLFVAIFHTTEYLVIYLRIIGMLIHTCMGVWLYHCLKGQIEKTALFLIVLLHMNFFPKWVQMPKFELMHYWFLLAIFLCLYSYFKGKGQSRVLLFTAGVCLSGSMLCYPTMLLLYPVYLIGLYYLEGNCNERQGAKRLQGCLWMTLGALVSGICFLLYVFHYQTLQEFWKNVSYIFMDESHTAYTMAEKTAMYLAQLKASCGEYGERLVVAAALAVLTAVVYMAVKRMKAKKFSGTAAILCILLLTAVLLQIGQITGCLFDDRNQFYLQVRYVAVLLPGVYLGIRYHKRLAIWFWLSVMPALVSLPAVLFMTNMDVNVSYSKLMVGSLGSLIMCFAYLTEEGKERKKLVRLLTYGAGLGMLAGFLICRVLLIRVTGCLPVTVRAAMDKVEYGPEKGIYMLEEQAQIRNENYQILQEMLSTENKLLYIGAENLIYLATGCEICTPSTQGTAMFNDIFLRYYEEHQDKQPDVVVIDKTFATNPVYGLFSDTEIVMDWLLETYREVRKVETDYMTILFLER